jgi:hypothetical protein
MTVKHVVHNQKNRLIKRGLRSSFLFIDFNNGRK